jgi:hypothetical protein
MTRGLALRFTKGRDKVDLLDLVHADGTAARVECPKQRIIPHDMVHFAVEEVLGAHGFLARVRDGEAADTRMIGNPTSDGVERLVEVMQADGWSPGQPAEAVIDLYRVTCDARDCPMLPIDAVTVGQLRARIAALTDDWARVPIGGTLDLRLD